MGLYEEILQDSLVTNEYKKYDNKFVDTDLATHGLGHVLNVVGACEKIAKLLNFSSVQIDEIKIAALLHDIGVGDIGKEGHAERSYEWAKNYLQKKDLNDESRQKILKAIKHHSSGTDIAYGRIVTFADKLDVSKQRLLPAGLKFKGNRQFAHIQYVDFGINDKTLSVEFVSDGQIDLTELNNYYFTPKIFNSKCDNVYKKAMIQGF